jgi:hypothetical protein
MRRQLSMPIRLPKIAPVKEGSSSSLLIALIGIVVPLVVQMNSCKEQELARIAKAKEVELAERSQDLERQMAFLDRAVNPQHSAEGRQQVLRFLRDVSRDGPTKAWATAELKTVNEEVNVLKKQLEQSRAQSELYRSQVAELDLSLQKSQRDAADTESLRSDLLDAQAKLKAAEELQQRAESKLTGKESRTREGLETPMRTWARLSCAGPVQYFRPASGEWKFDSALKCANEPLDEISLREDDRWHWTTSTDGVKYECRCSTYNRVNQTK